MFFDACHCEWLAGVHGQLDYLTAPSFQAEHAPLLAGVFESQCVTVKNVKHTSFIVTSAGDQYVIDNVFAVVLVSEPADLS